MAIPKKKKEKKAAKKKSPRRLKSFIFLCDYIKPQSTLTLFPGYMLKKATKAQVSCIRDFIKRYNNSILNGVNQFEQKPVKYDLPGAKGTGINWHSLEEKDWKYWVIEYSNTNVSESETLALALSNLNLQILFQGVSLGLFTNGGKETSGLMHNELMTVNHYVDSYRNLESKEKVIGKNDVIQIRKLHSSLQSFERIKNDYDDISKALIDYTKIPEVSIRSPFKILTYISILELLLVTYNAKVGHEGAIKYQLQKKVKLLNNQLKSKIDFKKFFIGPDTLTLEIIIEKIYDYRNTIAHGSTSDFSGKLHVLNSKETVLNFLEEVLRKMLVFSISHPQLVKDLKEC